MADDDPVAALLKRTPVPNSVRSTLWNAYYDAKTSDDLAAVLQTVKMPDTFKSELWNLKESEAAAQAPGAQTEQPYSGPPLPMPAFAKLPGVEPSTAGPRTNLQQFRQDYPDIEAQGDPIVPMGVLGAVAASGAAAKGAQLVRSIPTRAKAAAKFEQVMSKVGDKAVDLGGDVSASAMRVSELAERGGSMPKVVRDLFKRATDPAKSEPTYREMRDFYSNISRLSSKELQRLSPPIRRELGSLRVALDDAMAKVAASGGQEQVYREAMREYAIASRIANVVEKSVKYGGGALATAAGAKVAYDVLK